MPSSIELKRMTATFGLDQFSSRLLRDCKLRSFSADQSCGPTPIWFWLSCHGFCRLSAISRRRKVEYAWHADLTHQVNPEQEGEEKAPCVRKVVAPIGFGLTEFQVLRDGGGWLWNCGRRPARWATHQRCPRQAGRCAERIVHKSTAWLAVVNFPQGRYKRTSWLDTEKHSGNERSHGFCRRRAPQLMSWRTIRV